MITFKVGHEGKAVFLVPEDRIRASSEFVDAAMRGPWQESQERVITLPDFDRHTFGIYFQWLVTGVVHSRSGPTDGNDRFIVLDNVYGEILRLPQLCDLGHFLIDTDFRDTLNDIVTQCTSEMQKMLIMFPPDYGSRFYNKTPEGSPTRNLVTDLIAWFIEKNQHTVLNMDQNTMHPDFTMDLLLAVSRRLALKTPGKSPLDGWETSCKYHCHGDEKPCYRRKSDT